jgi:hypothetical protein
MAKKKTQLSWWLEVGTEVCHGCGHTYAHRTETFCIDCDGAVCPICVVTTETFDLVCPHCVESRNTESEVSR